MNGIEAPTTVNKIDANLLLDILTDGVDWACRGFWGQLSRSDEAPEDKSWWEWWYQDFDNDHKKLIPTLTPDTVLCKLRDDEDGLAVSRHRKYVGITLNMLAESTRWALEHYSHLFSRYEVVNGMIVDIDYDAIGADVILQHAVLKDVVYG